MSVRRLHILSEAKEELLEAAKWYEAKAPGLGRELVLAVDQALARIVERPEASALWKPPHPYRKHAVRRFPYLVFYRVADRIVHVLAVAHVKRRPGYWLTRSGR